MQCAWKKCHVTKNTEQLDKEAKTIDTPLYFCQQHILEANNIRKIYKDIEKDNDILHNLRKSKICYEFVAREIKQDHNKYNFYKKLVEDLMICYRSRQAFQRNIKENYAGEGHEYYIESLYHTLCKFWPLLIDQNVDLWKSAKDLNRKNKKYILNKYIWYRSKKRKNPWLT
jgi:hypothetical protein